MKKLGTVDLFHEDTGIKMGDITIVAVVLSDLELILDALKTYSFYLPSTPRESRLINEIEEILNEED